MKKAYRVLFVYSNEKRTSVDLGLTIGKYKTEGMAWTRAYQVLERETDGKLPSGRIEFKEVRNEKVK
jgi:hypothetical protein